MLSAKIRYLILLLGTILTACAVKVSAPMQVNCPLPVINCQSEQWKGLPYDTSADVVQFLDKYYVFEQVKQINTSNDDWALSFISPKKAVVTYNDGKRQNVMMVKMLSENNASIESGMGTSLEGSLGAMSINGDKAIFSHTANSEWLGNSNLYSGVLNGNLLIDAKPLSNKINKDEYSWEAQPAMTPDGNVVFFATDRQAGIGATDIWYSFKTGNGWSEPLNCGDMINTQCPELTPFVTPDGKQLFFASMGHQSIGGYDIFVSDISIDFYQAIRNGDMNELRNGKFFTKPKNLRPPLNTVGDELFPSTPIDPDSLLYYSSNQDQFLDSNRKTGFDIYVRRMIYTDRKAREEKKITDGGLPEETIAVVVPEEKPILPILYTVEGTVYNATTKEPLPDAEVTAKLKPEMSIYKQTNSDKQGNYSMILEKDRDYELTAQSKDLFFDTFTISQDRKDTVTIVHKDFNIPVILTLRINFPTDVYDAPYQFTLDSNGIETSNKWNAELNNLAKNIIDSKEMIKIINLSGHTDDVSSESYNYQLGLKRVSFIISELVKRGVPKELLLGRSAGEMEPLEKRFGEDLQLYRKRLRRVELEKVLK